MNHVTEQDMKEVMRKLIQTPFEELRILVRAEAMSALLAVGRFDPTTCYDLMRAHGWTVSEYDEATRAHLLELTKAINSSPSQKVMISSLGTQKKK